MKKLRKILAVCTLAMTLIGCSRSVQNDNIVNISVLNSKPEIQTHLEEAIHSFEESYPWINIKLVNYNQSQAYQDKLISMKEYGSTPTMILIDPAHIQYIKEDLVSLQDEKWYDEVSVELSDVAKNEAGELIAFPFALEGIGFIYNEAVLKEAGVDPTSIHSLEALEAAFKKIQAIGKGALIIANEDWSLASHFLPIAYSLQGKEGDGNGSFIQALKEGTADIKNNAVINGLLDTFDVMKAYNIYKDAPLQHTSAKCSELLAKGQVGFYYMGNWASNEIATYNSEDTNYGFIPVPVSKEEGTYGNHQIMAVIKYLVVDGKNNSMEQQEAARLFIDWLVYHEKGKDFMVNKANVIPGVENNEMVVSDPLMQSIKNYQMEGNIIELNNADLPGKNAEKIGYFMRQYLNNEIARDVLLEKIEAYWEKSF